LQFLLSYSTEHLHDFFVENASQNQQLKRPIVRRVLEVKGIPAAGSHERNPKAITREQSRKQKCSYIIKFLKIRTKR